MDNSYYYKQMGKLNEVIKESTEKKTSFFQHILLVSSSILGIILSLHTTNSQCLYIRLVFILSVILLLLGTILIAVVFYDFSNLQERTRQLFHSEIQNALKKNVEVHPVFVQHKKRTLIFEKLSYILLLLALFSLVAYNILISFS